MEQQRTVGKEVRRKGIGLHSGQEVTVAFQPASPNSGVRFIRIDLPGRPEIKSNISSVVEAPRRRSLGRNGITVHTVEHLLAALYGLGIDNCIVQVDGEEIPEIDGSARPFVELLKEGGIVEQGKERHFFHLNDPISVSEGEAYLVALPSDEFRISFHIGYNCPSLRSQFASFTISEETFEKELAPARTYCLEEWVDDLRRQGLGKGATLENTILVKEGEMQDLRFPDEFVRHKILDLVGDLSLFGLPIRAHLVAVRSGHSLNMKLLRRMEEMVMEKQGEKRRTEKEEKTLLDVDQICRILPHRYPFLMVDRIIELEEDRRIVGIKNVTANEAFFVGHFPQRPVMPGVLILEAMAQTAGVLMLKKEENKEKLAYLLGVDRMKLRKPVVPGDCLRLEVEVVRLHREAGKVKAKAMVNGRIVAEAEMVFGLVK